MLVLDLCAGRKGASQPMLNRGWQVLTLDNETHFNCTFTTDIRDWHYPTDLPTPDLIWASPPCSEFSRESMPWCKTGIEPDMSIVLSCKRIIDEVHPTFWVIENTRGAVEWFRPHLGSYRLCVGPYFLWGFFPPPGTINHTGWHKKSDFSSAQSERRALIPKSLATAIAVMCERQLAFQFPSL